MSTTHISEPTEPNAKSKGDQLLETISLRDYFAAKAIASFIFAGCDYERAAFEAYKQADAMLEARKL